MEKSCQLENFKKAIGFIHDADDILTNLKKGIKILNIVIIHLSQIIISITHMFRPVIILLLFYNANILLLFRANANYQ